MSGRLALGIDVGATCVSAAVATVADAHASVTTVSLGERSDTMPAALFVDEDGTLLVGEPARHRGLQQPGRLALADPAAIGGPAPHLVGGRALAPERVVAELVADAVATVATQQGTLPDVVGVTHPAEWGPHRVGLLRAALGDLDLPDVLLVAEPVAAAIDLDVEAPLRIGQAVAVVDLGGTATRCSVVRKVAEDRFDVVPTSLERAGVGGIDFDDLILRHVLGATPDAVEPDPEALATLRGECVDAKEDLSLDARATIPVRLADHTTTIRLTRTEFEQLADPALDQVVEALEASLDGAGCPVQSVAMVGGSARLPRAMQRLSEARDSHVAPGAHPASAMARGAARVGLASLAAVEEPEPAAPAGPRRALPASDRSSLPGWVRWVAIAAVSAVILVILVLVANGLGGPA